MYEYVHDRGATDEREFVAICERISHAKQHFHDLVQYMTELKKEKPKAVSD